MTAPTTYAEIVGAVRRLIAHHQIGNDATVSAYMVARAALLEVRACRGADRAAELAYKLADEFAGEGL